MTVSTFPKKDRFIENSIEQTTETTDVQSGNKETVEFTPPSDEIWEFIGARCKVQSDSDAASGDHAFYINTIGTTGFADADFTVENSYDGDIDIWRNTINEGNLRNYSGDFADLVELTAGALVETNDKFVFIYENDTNVAQENDRTFRVFVRKWEA